MNAPARISTAPTSQWLDPHPSLGISMMDHLFNRLDGAYPNRWRASFPNAQTIANWRESWAEVFEEEKLTPNDVKEGLRVCRTKFDWPPSIAEFVKCCRKSIDPVLAYYEAVNGMQARERREMGEWSHPAVFWAAMEIGAFDLKNKSFSELKQRWEAALRREYEKGEWEQVPRPAEALVAPQQGRISKENARRMVDECMGILKKKIVA